MVADRGVDPRADSTSKTDLDGDEPLDADAERELQQLKTTLRNNIQSSRMQCHAFEPVSLPGSQPTSRVRNQSYETFKARQSS